MTTTTTTTATALATITPCTFCNDGRQLVAVRERGLTVPGGTCSFTTTAGTAAAAMVPARAHRSTLARVPAISSFIPRGHRPTRLWRGLRETFSLFIFSLPLSTAGTTRHGHHHRLVHRSRFHPVSQPPRQQLHTRSKHTHVVLLYYCTHTNRAAFASPLNEICENGGKKK